MIDITTSGTLTASNLIDINFGAVADTGDGINIALGATAVAAQAIVVDSAGASSTNGWVLAADNSGDAIWTGDMLSLRTGTGSSTGDIIDITMEATALGDAQAIVLTNADVSDQAGWLMDIDTSAAWIGNMMDIDLGAGVSTANVLDITYATAAHTGNAIDLNMGTNVAGDGLNIAQTSPTTGQAMQIDTTLTDATAGVFDFNVTTDTGDVEGLNIAMTSADDNDDATETMALLQLNATQNSDDATNDDLLIGLDVAALVNGGTAVGQTAIRIGNVWDVQIGFNDTSSVIRLLQDAATLAIQENSLAVLVNITDAASTSTVMEINGELIIELDNGATDEAICGEDGDADVTDVTVRDCSAAPVADYAERYPVAQGITYGDIVVPGTKKILTYHDAFVGHERTDDKKEWIVQLVKSSEAYQGPVSGIVSDNYGDFTSAGNNIPDSENPMPIALVGRVPVNVTNENGPISIGDFITTSSTPGKGMKATKAGRVIGMALGDFAESSGKVMVQVVNTWYQPSDSASNNLQGGNNTGSSLIVVNSVEASDGSFNGSVSVAEHLYGSRDMAGRVRLKAGSDKVHVTFEKEYAYLPIVTFSLRSEDRVPGNIWVSDEDKTGFTINHSAGSTTPNDLEFNWIAIGVDEAMVTISDGKTERVEVTVMNNNSVVQAPVSAPVPAADKIITQEDNLMSVDKPSVVDEPTGADTSVQESEKLPNESLLVE